MGLILLLLSLATALLSPGEALAAGQRIALVIGNSDYPVRKLLNPVNDASDVATLLVTKLAFARDDVIVERDSNAEGQRRALARFEQKLKTAPGAVGFFYFAGHGAQIAGRNYLLPAKNPIRSGEDAKALGLRVTDVLDAMRDGGASLMIVVLDACRDDPFPGGSRGSRGLQRENPPNGSLIAYAAAAEGTADDDERQRNGVYTRFLLRRLAEPGLTLEQVFKRVRGDVRQATNGRQEPEVLLALEGEQDFYFLGVTPDPRADEESFWLQARQLGSSEAYESYLARYPRGRYAALAQGEVRRLAKPPPVDDFAAGKVFRDCPECPPMVVIPAGEFVMGSPESEEGRYENEGLQHRVRIGGRFALGRNEVTVADFRRFVQASGYRTSAENDAGKGCYAWDQVDDKWDWRSGRHWREPGYALDDQQPVACVSWEDARAYAQWLAKLTGKGYRLPSEAEWEYAARAGSTSARPWGDNPGDACTYANVRDRTTHEGRPWSDPKHECSDGYWFPAPVGRYQPNRFGLYDTIGNVWEWVQDCYQQNYDGAPSDGSAWQASSCEARVLRGGSWSSLPRNARSASRLRNAPAYRGLNSGFRLARTLP